MDENTPKPSKPKSSGRTRSYNGYSRNGCSRCKGQRVRCDEQQPECGRCVRAGAKCPGYGQRLRWSTKYEVFRAAPPKKQKIPKEPKEPVTKESAAVDTAPESSTTTQTADPVELPIQDEDHHFTNEAWDSLLDHMFPELSGPSDPIFGDGSTLGDFEIQMPGLDAANGLFELEHRDSQDNHGVLPITPIPPQDETSQQKAVAFNRPRSVSWDSESDPSMNWTEVTLTTMPNKSLNDPASVLVEFYFKETAQLFSCYDSRMNPFRTTVSRRWTSSPLLYRTLQSMAAASLVEDFPQFSTLGRQLRKEAMEMLDKSAASDLDSLLAMLMLGGSASWHDPRDLGLQFFNRVRKSLASLPPSAFYEEGMNNYRFFSESMTYWEMLLSYVAEDDALEAADDLLDPPLPQVVPHPWTGFARDTQHTVQKVGRLIRRQRKIAFARRFTSTSHIRQLERDMAAASELEKHLVNLSHPQESAVVDPEDGNTPVWHLLTLAEVYRATGLLQLYHVFPDLLTRRLHRESGMSSLELPAHVRNQWLTSYAVKTLEMMKLIPLESGTRDFQPFILVALSSELRTGSSAENASETAVIPADMSGLNFQSIEVSRMRHFIKSRLNSFLHTLPPRPIHVCLDIVQTTWETMDQHAAVAPSSVDESWDDVYWMDIMIQNRWETTMA